MKGLKIHNGTQEIGPNWNVNTKRLTPFQAELWDAYGDTCAAWEEERNERAVDRW